jgi:hypothetical protein
MSELYQKVRDYVARESIGTADEITDAILSLVSAEVEKLRGSQDARMLDQLPGSYSAALRDVLALLKGADHEG